MTENMETSESARGIGSVEGTIEPENTEQGLSTQSTGKQLPAHSDTNNEPSRLPITHALEALLGGLEESELEPTPSGSDTADAVSIPTSVTQERDATDMLLDTEPLNQTTHVKQLETAQETTPMLLEPNNALTGALSVDHRLEHLGSRTALHDQVEAPNAHIPGLGLLQNGHKVAVQIEQIPMDHVVEEPLVHVSDPSTNQNIEGLNDAAIESTNTSTAMMVDNVDMPGQDHVMDKDALGLGSISGTDKPEVPIAEDARVGSLNQDSATASKADIKSPVPDSTTYHDKDVQMSDIAQPHAKEPSESVPETTAAENGRGVDGPEWEADSSPIESSSDDSSSDDSSSDESDEGDNAYKLLNPEEQARILMKGDGDSDDEDGKGKGAGAQLRTKNEVPEVVIPKPTVEITESMPITELGPVEQIVDNILLIKANVTGEYKILESGSVLCLADRSVFGVVAETIGRVQQPFYSVLFTNAGELTAAGLSNGVKTYYSDQHSKFVFTQALKAIKGSDASNLHDEEVGDEEMEFSDDEAEAEHKRRVKQKRLDKKGGKQQNGTSTRGGHPPRQQQHAPYDPSQGISYDDNDDGPYTPLARPASYVNTVGRSEAPEEGAYSANQNNNNREQMRDQFRGRGRGDRGRGRGRGDRGDRGRGRGSGNQDRRPNSGFSLPQQSPAPSNPQSLPSATQFSQAPFHGQIFQQSPNSSVPMAPPNFYNVPPMQQYSPNQPQLPVWPQYQPQNYPPSSYQGQRNPQSNWSGPPLPGLSGGAFVNPAFFNQNNQPGNAGSWNQPNQHGGKNNRGV